MNSECSEGANDSNAEVGAESVIVGKNLNAPFVAFGDDSQFRNLVSYVFVLIERKRLDAVSNRIAHMKKHYGVPDDVLIHCSAFFNIYQREKLKVAHLSDVTVRAIIRRSMRIINQEQIWLRYAIADLNTFRIKDGPLHDKEGNEGPVSRFSHDPKAIIALMAQACYAVPPDGSRGPPSNLWEIQASEDSTRIRMFDDKSARADKWYGGFNDFGAPAGFVHEVRPGLVKSNAHPALQLADIAAYVVTHGFKASGFYREQLDSVKRWSNVDATSAEFP